MKQQSIFLFFISVFLVTIHSFSQNEKVKDTLILKDTYGLRIGLDLSNPIRTIINSDRKSVEIVADYRLNKKFYAATEIGFLDRLGIEDRFRFSTKGEYIKLGANYNTYKNWLNMDNEIYLGLRYGFATFSQEIEDYVINPSIILPEINHTDNIKYSGLNANWMEFVLGIKAEIYSNVYLGFSVNAKKMLFTKEPDNFKNLYVPGFDRVFLNDAGVGFNYTISYRLPLYKKDKK